MLKAEDACLVVVDIQGKLADAMYDKKSLFRNVRILIKAAQQLHIPLLLTEQVPKSLGPTIEQISELLDNNEPIGKSAFSCCGEPAFREKLSELGRKDVILCGIETHVCIYQTAVDLVNLEFRPQVIADAVSSRTEENKRRALQRIADEGAKISGVEMILFELLQSSEHPAFKAVSRLIK